MPSSSASGQWWRDRLMELRQQGFDTRAIEYELVHDPAGASVLLDDYERLVLLCTSLEGDIELLPAHLEFEKRELSETLKKAEEAPEVERRLLSLMAAHRPWRLNSKRNRPLWRSAGLEKELDGILARLDALDSSMYSQAHDLLDLLDQPEMIVELKQGMIDIEQRQSERGAAQENMVIMLRERGFEVSGIEEMNLAERFERLQELQELEVKHAQLERMIMQTIGRFDVEAASDLNSQRKLLTGSRSSEEFNALVERVTETGADLAQRLEDLNHRFDLWTREGLRLGVVLPLLADELLVWEPRVEMLSISIEEYNEVWNRLQAQLLIWPDEPGIDAVEFGDLSDRDRIEDLVKELENRTEVSSDMVGAAIATWEKRGFDMGTLSSMRDQSPRRAESRLTELVPLLERAHEGLLKLESLDRSMLDAEVISGWKESMQGSSPEAGEVLAFEDWLSAAEKRNFRHREMLDEDWGYICSGDIVDGLDTSLLSLTEFEDLVTQAQRGGLESVRASLEGRSTTSVSGLMARMRGDLDIWIDSFRRDGWDVSGLESMLEHDHPRLMRELPEIRELVDGHEQFFRRIERLDWGRDPVLAERTLADLRRPERLPEISRDVRHLMLRLSASSADVEFEFNAWRPRPGAAIFTPLTGLGESSPQGVLPLQVQHVETKVIEGEAVDEDREVSLSVDEMDEQSPPPPKPSRTPEEPETSQPRAPGATRMEGWVDYIRAVEGVMHHLGLRMEPIGDSPDLGALEPVRKAVAPKVGLVPRDTRVDRLLRIFLRCMPLRLPDGVDFPRLTGMLGGLDESAGILSKWTIRRLERRHALVSKGLLANSEVLGEALKRIPSPAFAIPLEADYYEIPSIDQMQEFEAVARQLHSSIRLPKAGERPVPAAA